MRYEIEIELPSGTLVTVPVPRSVFEELREVQATRLVPSQPPERAAEPRAALLTRAR